MVLLHMIHKMKLPKKYGYLVAAVLMPLGVSLGGTFLHAAYSVGINAAFFGEWFSEWYHAYRIALPISLASAPLVRRIVEGVTR